MSAKTPRLHALDVKLIDLEEIERLAEAWEEEPHVYLDYSCGRLTVTIKCHWADALKPELNHVAGIDFPTVRYDGKNWLVYRGKRPGRVSHILTNRKGNIFLPQDKRLPKPFRDFLAVIRNAALQPPQK